MRVDEVQVPTRIGDAPPLLPFRKPFDLTAWQLPLMIGAVAAALIVDLPLSDQPFQEGTAVSPQLSARVVIFMLGCALVFIRPGERMLLVWLWVAQCHFWRAAGAVYAEHDRGAGPMFFAADAADMVRMKLTGEGTLFVVDPPWWQVMKHTPGSASYWAKHVPYRLLLPVEAQGALELMTDVERANRCKGFAAGLKALRYPVQIVAQTRDEDVEWLAERAMPPEHSPFAHLREPIGNWAREKARGLQQRRIIVACSAPTAADLVEHVHDVSIMLNDAGLSVREMDVATQRDLFDQVYGARHFYPHSTDYYGVDDTDWVTIAVRRFPRTVAVGWVMFVIERLPVRVGLFIEPDDGSWITRQMEHFQGMSMLDTADTAHHDAAADCAYVEGKVKRNEDSIQRATLLLTMPKSAVPRVSNNLRKSGAVFAPLRFEHQVGFEATLPKGGTPRVGSPRPYDGESVAACFPFGSGGLRSKGALLGTARGSAEAVTLDVQDEALPASMVVILGVPGAGKTFLMQQLILRSGLPFVLIDMKLHLDEIRHGDFYPFTIEAKGNYHVCLPGKELPTPHPFAQTYNLASLSREEQQDVLVAIAKQEWMRALDSLEDRIFAIDECNLLGQTEPGREFIEQVVSQGRSAGLIGICATQEVMDFLKESRMSKAVTMSSMQFVLAQEHSNVDKVADSMKLGGEAREELRKFMPQPGDTLAATSRNAILRVGQRMCSFRIEASPVEMNLYTTKPSDRRAQRAAAVAAKEEVAV